MSCGEKLMEKIQDLSQPELQDLLDDAGKIEALVLESDEVQTAQLDREMTLASNRSLAEQNLALKPQLESQRDHLVEKYSELEGVRETYRLHCSQRDGIMGQVTPEGLLSQLQTAGGSTEADSETLAEHFLDGSLPLEHFLEQFLSLRSLAHKRRVRIEKLQEILRQKVLGSGVEGQPGGITSQTPAVHESGAASPWQPHQQQQHSTDQQPGGGGAESKPEHGSGFPNSSSQSTPSLPMPYAPYPVSPPNRPPVPTSASGPSNPQAQFQPYPGQSFTVAPSFPTPAPGFPGAHAGFSPGSCPYPLQPSFPGPPRSQFRPYSSADPPYPSSFQYPGYNYTPGPPSQPPSGRPLYRPGFGLPQSYS
ncbi:hypothetical protein GJAV_G00248870 [Gymnothorax javanicus]|nr:hypothetical protein GJAV_G00248870 [Gymnothorax javanicus]